MSAKERVLELKLKTLPENPGIYKFLDKSGTVLYVGKAKNLKKRVSSYFNKQTPNGKTALLVRQIVDIHYLIVASEFDALLLENSLIKELQPKYNIQLKDDKTYPWICVKNESFPRVFMTRNVIHDGSTYYGPYASVVVAKTLLELIRELYPLRTCSLDLSPDKIANGKYKVCLEYHLKNCFGPCVGGESIDQYQEYIAAITLLLKGNLSALLKNLRTEMHRAATALNFEQAQTLKGKIERIERYQSRSTVVSPTIKQVDVIGLVHDGSSAYVNYLSVERGAIIHGLTVEVRKKLEESDTDIIGLVLPEMRAKYGVKTREVLVANMPEISMEGIQFVVPKIGDKKALLELSERNARVYRLEKLKNEKITQPEMHTRRVLDQLRTDFHLPDAPQHIECFDNSNLQGTNAVSACVVFRDAKPSKKEYRHFNIRSVEGPNDFASMEEVVYRRYKRLLDEGESLPQLIVIDGGKGQLSAALSALEKLGIRGKVAIVGIAKRLEEIFFPGDSLPIYLDKRSESLKVIQHMRNEAHRFGITHHRNKRSGASINSELTQIKGFGEKTMEILLREFKSVKGIKSATPAALEKVIGPAKTKTLRAYFEQSR